MNPRQNHGKRALPVWQRMSERKRLQLSYRELLAAVGDLSAQHQTFLEKHNALVLAYKHLQLEVRALRRLADPSTYYDALNLEVEDLKARMAEADVANTPQAEPAQDSGGSAA